MILFHGSEKIVDIPIYGKGNKNNDYGRGFYCTCDEELAKEWACSKNNNGFANKYEFDMSDLKVLNLNSDAYVLLNWLALLAKNRTYWENSAVSETAKKYISENFTIDVSKYDVIIGYRADDSYFSFAQDFVSGAISYRQLGEAMKLGKLGEQIVLVSPKAFEKIKYISNSPADSRIYYKKKKERDRRARFEYRKTKQDGVLPSDLLCVRGWVRMTNAYDRDYLHHAQKNFAHMVDFAVNTCNYDLDDFFSMFLASSVCRQFEDGNPAYIVGKTGPELARIVVKEIKDSDIEEDDVMFLDKSPEYWLGWALSFYAWNKNYKFAHILTAVSPNDMICMYDTMHEADITKFVSAMDERLTLYYDKTALTRMRISAGISQSELAMRSGVNMRVIQSYEQRLRDINKAQIGIILNLANALDCSVEDLLV